VAKAKTSSHQQTKAPAAGAWKECVERGVRVLQAPNLAPIPWLVHGFSTRPGGISALDDERVLNTGAVEWDSRENVTENRRRLQSAAGGTELKLIPLSQFHSDVICAFQNVPAEPGRGDASVTRTPGLLLAVQTADCVPILLLDPGNRAVAAVHAGWRGTLRRILGKTVGRMQMEFGSRPQDLLAAIGPAIGGCCYQVGTEVASAFAAQFSNAADFFDELRTGGEPNPLQWLNRMPPGHQPAPNKVLLNLRAANRWQLLEAEVPEQNIVTSDLCTACHTELLFSYRKEGSRSGRLMSVVGILPDSR